MSIYMLVLVACGLFDKDEAEEPVEGIVVEEAEPAEEEDDNDDESEEESEDNGDGKEAE